mgnify:CR=1 FL=1
MLKIIMYTVIALILVLILNHMSYVKGVKDGMTTLKRTIDECNPAVKQAILDQLKIDIINNHEQLNKLLHKTGESDD